MKFIGNVVIMLGQYKSFLLLGVFGILWLKGAEAGIRAFDTTSECSAEGRKNILFLVVDDLNAWLLNDRNRYTGKVIAPNIRKLARSGVNFTQAFTAAPECSPSRTAFLSGIAPWNSGVYENGQVTSASPALKGIESLSVFFKNRGYFTASGGKINHGWTADGWQERLGGWRDPLPPDHPLNGMRNVGTIKDWGRFTWRNRKWAIRRWRTSRSGN